MSKSKRSKATADEVSNLKQNGEFSQESNGESSYVQSSFEMKSTQVKALGRETRMKISKQELKRVKNREAARKSRNLKKDLLNRLTSENNILKEENSRLKLEIQSLKTNKQCTECTMKSEGQPQEEPFESMPVAQEIVGEHLSSKTSHRKTDDDLRFQRIVADSDNLYGWQKYFLAIIFVVLVFWVKREEVPNKANRFGFFSFSFHSHENNHTMSNGEQDQ